MTAATHRGKAVPMPRRPLRLAAPLAVFLAGLLPALAVQAASATGGTINITVRHDGMKRTALVHTPPQIAERRSLPLVINFHGGGGNAIGHQRYARMDALAEREGFIVVYPNCTVVLHDSLLTWNAGTC